MIKVSLYEEDLVLSASDAKGQPLEYKIDVAKLKIPTGEYSLHLNYSSRLRSLLRVDSNLSESIELLDEIQAMIKKEGVNAGFTSGAKALFCHAVILYGACFLKGGKAGVRPLKHEDLSGQHLQVHRKIMDFRDKLFSHLDDDHDVRHDQIYCHFKVNNAMLEPVSLTKKGSRTVLPSEAVTGAWGSHIKYLRSIALLEAEKLKHDFLKFLISCDFPRIP